MCFSLDKSPSSRQKKSLSETGTEPNFRSLCDAIVEVSPLKVREPKNRVQTPRADVRLYIAQICENLGSDSIATSRMTEALKRVFAAKKDEVFAFGMAVDLAWS
jgi:hypothetical protein